jgi:hypothetical protein
MTRCASRKTDQNLLLWPSISTLKEPTGIAMETAFVPTAADIIATIVTLRASPQIHHVETEQMSPPLWYCKIDGLKYVAEHGKSGYPLTHLTGRFEM